MDHKSPPHKWMRRPEPFELGLICLVAFKRRPHPPAATATPREYVWEAVHIIANRSALDGSPEKQIWKWNQLKISICRCMIIQNHFYMPKEFQDFPPENCRWRWSALLPTTMRCHQLFRKTRTDLRGRQDNAGEKPQQSPLISVFKPIRCYAVFIPPSGFDGLTLRRPERIFTIM